jgi:prevent-host-death family protein
MTREIPVTQARAELAELVNRVAYSGERVVLTRHGRPLAALVSAADLELLEAVSERRIALASIGPAEHAPSSPAHEDAPLRIVAEHRPGGYERPGGFEGPGGFDGPAFEGPSGFDGLSGFDGPSGFEGPGGFEGPSRRPTLGS